MRLYVNSSEDLSKEQLAKVSTDPEELAMLANDEDKWIRRDVAWNDNCPIEVLEKLSNDIAPQVRVACVKNGTLEMHKKLADDEHRWVREEVAKHSDDITILKKLSRDVDEETRKTARKRMKALNIAPKFNPDWSIPLESVTNYSQIEREIDEVIDKAANRFSEKTTGEVVNVKSPHGVYDDGGQIVLQFRSLDGEMDFPIDVKEILPLAISSNDKKECIRAVFKWMDANF